MAVPAAYAVEQLAELVDAWAYRRAPSPVAMDWLGTALAGYVRDQGGLEELLGLAGAGVESVPALVRRLRRDDHLARAALAMTTEAVPDLWECCKRLAPEVRAFEARIWSQRAVQRLVDPPASWEAHRCHLFRAFQIGLGVPTSPQGLRDRVKRIPPFSLHEEPARVLARFI